MKANHFTRVDSDRYWPADVRWIRDSLEVEHGTPRFIVVSDGKILLHKFGIRAWASDVFPLLQRLVAERAKP